MKKCCTPYSAGKLDQQIAIQRKSRSADGMGGYTETWATVASVWASIKITAGGERYAAMQLSSNPRAKAVIRFRGDDNGAPYYSGSDRVLYRGRYWAIDSVIDPDGRQRWLELALIEGKAS